MEQNARGAMMRVHGLFHAPFEGLANIEVWAKSRGHAVAHSDLFAGQSAPAPLDYDFLVVMGGPMNIYEENVYPWLGPEKAAIAAGIRAGKPVLGVCLGAQLIADILGGPVTQGKHKEIGWFDVEMTESGAALPVFAGFPGTFTAFHWHGDTFAIPPGAVRAASSRACANQAFVFQDKVVGLQFHLETSQASLADLADHCANEIVDGPYIQDLTAMRLGFEHLPRLSELLFLVLDNMAGLAG